MFRRGVVRCNYCNRIIRIVPKSRWKYHRDNTQVSKCYMCQDERVFSWHIGTGLSRMDEVGREIG